MHLSSFGAAFVVFASLGAFASDANGQQRIGELAEGGKNDQFGSSCTGIGDVDGDGVPDVLVGAEWANAPYRIAGRAYVFSGATLALLVTLDGENAGDRFGKCVLALPDIDGDGVDDYIVAAPYHDTSVGNMAGRISVYSGGSGLLIRTQDGSTSSYNLGASMAAIRDLDADGVGDYLVSAPGNGGCVYAYSGASGALLFTTTGSGTSQFGFTLATIGDVDGDGIDDFAAGSWSGGNGRGLFDVISGATQAKIVTVFGVAPDDAGLAKSLAGGGDFDGDGVPDLVVGDPDHLVNGIATGAVIIYSGATWSPIATWYGRVDGDGFGQSASCVGDANGDGVPDVLVGSVIGSKRRGNAYLFSGRTFDRLFRFVSDAPATRFGVTIGAAGDLTGDGIADLLVGAVYDSKRGFEAGRVFAFAGNDLFLDANGRAFHANDVIHLGWHGANAATLSALAIVDVASVPCFTIVDLGATDALGGRSYSATVPAGLTGIDVSLQAFSLDPVRGPIDSAVVTLSFL